MSSVVVPASVREPAAEPGSLACRLQHLPCRVEHRGPAPVQQRFTPLVAEKAPGVLEGQFRGHPLDGSTVVLPPGYEGLVVRADQHEDGTTYRATEKFSRYTVWNWDRAPSQNDASARLQDWFEVANAIHSTTEDEN